METAIETLKDRIIYLTGQIALIQKEDVAEIVKKVVTKGWEKEIEELKKAQSILTLTDVTQQRELLENYQHFIDWNEEHDRKASKSERIESFIAYNCG
jgi:hypothetical protein